MSTNHYLGFLDPELEQNRSSLEPLLKKYAESSRIPWKLLPPTDTNLGLSIQKYINQHPQPTFVAIGSDSFLAQLISATCSTKHLPDGLPVFAQIQGPKLKNGPVAIINWLYERQSRTAFTALAGRKVINEPLFSVNQSAWFRSRIVLIPNNTHSIDERCHFILTTLQGKLNVQAPAEKIIFQAMQSPEYPKPYLTISVTKPIRTVNATKSENILTQTSRHILPAVSEDVFHSPLIVAQIRSNLSWHSEIQPDIALPGQLTIQQAPFALQRIVLKNDITQY